MINIWLPVIIVAIICLISIYQLRTQLLRLGKKTPLAYKFLYVMAATGMIYLIVQAIVQTIQS